MGVMLLTAFLHSLLRFSHKDMALIILQLCYVLYQERHYSIQANGKSGIVEFANMLYLELLDALKLNC